MGALLLRGEDEASRAVSPRLRRGVESPAAGGSRPSL
jgi:hypothetical protein